MEGKQEMRDPDVSEAQPMGCLSTTTLLATALLAFGDLLLVTFALAGPTPFGVNGILAALLILIAFLSLFAASVATVVGRSTAGRTGLSVLAIRLLGLAVVAAVVAASIWYAVGDPATGTLTEVPVLALGPPLAGLLAFAVAPRGARRAALAFVILGLLTAGLVAITVARSQADQAVSDGSLTSDRVSRSAAA